MNNNIVWTIVGILAILALLIFIFAALSDNSVNTMGLF